MQNDAVVWKKKYLELLDKQEKVEAGFNTQTQLLKRALIRSSLAAEGNDQQLDQQLQTLRTFLRKDINNSELESHINQLEKAVLKSEKNQQQRKVLLGTTLTQLTQQLQQLQPAKDIQKELKLFEKNLHTQLAQPHNLQILLNQLKELQGRAFNTSSALDQTAPPASGIFSRLFKTAESRVHAKQEQDLAEVTNDEQEQATDTPKPLDPSALTTETDIVADPEHSESTEQAEPIDNTDDSYALPLLMEASYSSVAKHIHQTLTSLLNDLPISDVHEQQVLGLRSRINKGLNWYELAPLLDELSCVILAIANGSDNGLEQYLFELNQRLASFHDSLQATSSGYTESVKDAQTLDNDLRQHVTSFHDDVHTSTDLNDLKKLVDTRLDSFINTLQIYQEKRVQTDSAILERFQALTEHSKQLEQEAQQLTTKLEEQRQKALLDPLTGLANRAAWNERSELEYARIQRNDSSLLLSIIDIDHFKRINDNYGHLAGDKVLRLIAQELKKRLRKTDFIARFGGEEYAILLPDTPLNDGYQLINELRLAIAACPFHFKGEPVTITFSAGIGQVSAKASLDHAFERIDQALYAAKDAGRNQVATASSDNDTEPNAD